MRASRIAKATVQMTVREREMNGNILRLLQGDKDLQAKIRYVCSRVLQGCCVFAAAILSTTTLLITAV